MNNNNRYKCLVKLLWKEQINLLFYVMIYMHCVEITKLFAKDLCQKLVSKLSENFSDLLANSKFAYCIAFIFTLSLFILTDDMM